MKPFLCFRLHLHCRSLICSQQDGFAVRERERKDSKTNVLISTPPFSYGWIRWKRTLAPPTAALATSLTHCSRLWDREAVEQI